MRTTTRLKLYIGGVAEDAKTFSSVLKIVATDADTGNYSANAYRLIIPPTTDGQDSFVIEQYTGIIKTAIMYRNMRRSYFKFAVIATDNYGEGLSSSADVVVSSPCIQRERSTPQRPGSPSYIAGETMFTLLPLRGSIQKCFNGAAKKCFCNTFSPCQGKEQCATSPSSSNQIPVYCLILLLKKVTLSKVALFLDGKLLDINKEFQPFLGQGGRILEIRTPDIVASVKKAAQAVGYTEGALLALAIIIILCCIPAILIIMVTYKQRQAECAKTARIQQALPASKAAAPRAPTANIYGELGDSSTCWVLQISHVPYICGLAKRFEIDEADRQRRLSSFACRANSSCGNGSLHSILPKSESNVTFLSDHHPLTTTNPLYDEEEDGNFSSPYGTAKRGSFSPSLSGGSGNAWTMRTRLRGGSEGYESLKRQALMDPAQWELQLLQAGMKGQGSLEGYDVQSSRSTEESKLSVREQARQYEQQAMQERTPRGGRDSRGSLTSPPLLRNQDNIDMLDPYSPLSIGKDVPPRIIITQGEGSPPLAQRPTLPVLRTGISSYITAEPCEITVEIIPDPPENPPPPPPSPHSPPPPSPHSPPPPPPSQTPHSVCPNLPAAIVLAPPYFLPGPSPSYSPPTRGRCEEEGAKGDSEKPAEPR
ncbi:unnamed protein product [Oncorhynchus mykiss]|uniref:Cadherin domain-containing protein n=1 Tax=Oncorhynchus mykiss TaxID=8022 RepID=A0A060XHU1_ONCMY|nr:unnamed protein product [Oncorhynchus mykiss]